MNSRPKQLIGVLGTQTEIGKTWVSAQLLSQARAKGLRVAARKPAQSFEPGQAPTDAEQLAAATGEQPDDVCPKHRNYPLALAPPMAADLLQRPRITLDELIGEIRWPDDIDIGLVETVGGPRSPLSHDADSVDLIQRLRPDRILLVADAGLGTLNAVRVSLASIEPLLATVLLNRFDASNELHRLNREWLVQRYRVQVATEIAELL
ncbi:MAG TPA: dethiobiotin synthase [Povalibacter sp.]|nr:dethiobiotin synthase [Povalibacter sp.]